jgi:hypothetical protein
LLPGTELNSKETWEKFSFRTRRRLIHGDAGKYKAANGDVIPIFEYEESLRETTTMSEEDMFYLRKYHFLVDFCWSLNVYKPLLKFVLDHGVNPNEIFKRLVDLNVLKSCVSQESYLKMAEFWERYEKASQEEWFDTDEEIESFFESEENFDRIINQEFEKLHIQFSMIVFKEYKKYFDMVLRDIIKSLVPSEAAFIDEISNIVSKMFPSLDDHASEHIVTPTAQLLSHDWLNLELSDRYRGEELIRFVASGKRLKMMHIIENSGGKTLSKVLNTSNMSVRELQYEIDTSFGIGQNFKETLEA